MAELTLPVLREWQTSVLGHAGQAVAAASASVDDHLLGMQRAMDIAQDGWSGDTAAAALGRIDRVLTAGNRTATALVSLSDVLASAATGLQHAKDDVLAAVEDARAQGYLVFDDGRVQGPAVTFPAGSSPSTADNAAAQQASSSLVAQQHATTISQRLAAAAQTDVEWAAKIIGAVNDVQDMANKAVTKDSGGLSPAVPSDPRALHNFWAACSAEEKEALFAAEPGIGNRDGIPVVDRDHFNQRHLADLRAAERDKLEGLLAEHPEGQNGFLAGRYAHGQGVDDSAAQAEWKAKVDASTELIRGYDAVTTGVGDGPNGVPPRYLLGVDGADRAVVATGNPDTATNVATMVPGTSSTLSGIGGDLDRGTNLYDQTLVNGASSAAVVTWFGYDAPPTLERATDEVFAEKGAPALDSFQDGLRVTHDGPPSYNTVVGHSYGTTLVGTAATGSASLNADTMVLVGSPGAMADNVTDFHLDGVDPADNTSHVYASTARYDPVQLYDITGDFGRDPNGFGFGATTFTSDSEAGPWYALGWNPDDHSSYWDQNSQSLDAMADIVAGNGASLR